MEHIIIGTAGHIDHGKTALIRALTGRETDTKKEEKQRGISIDLGFTWFDLPDGNRAGIVDVPGHEKFLPNMLSGVYGLDMVLLVIALDEGIKPQTKEHMEILEQLGVSDGILVFTKVDCVEPEWAELMEEEICEELKGTRFETWSSVAVSSIDGTGMEELRHRIVSLAQQIQHHRNVAGRFRMPVDRIFSLSGRGTVIAGTVLEGSVHEGETLQLYPQKQPIRIRGIQIHGEESGVASAGQRAAFLIAGLKREAVKRGNVAAYPDSLNLAERLDCKVTLSETTNRVLKNQMRVHLHIGAAQLLCRVILFEKNELQAGESCYAQLVLEEPIAVKKKDRFVLRFYSPLETIGGGVVLDECARKHKRSDVSVPEYLRRKEEDKEGEILLNLIENAVERPIGIGELSEKSGLGKELVKVQLEELRNQQIFAVLEGKKATFYWGYDATETAERAVREWMESYHKHNPYRKGAAKTLLKSQVCRKWENDRFDALLVYLEQEHIVEREEDNIRLYGFEIREDARFQKTFDFLKRSFSEAGFQFLNYTELCPKQMTSEMYEDMISILESRGDIVRISENFYTTRELAEQVKEMVREYFQTEEILSYVTLRDLLGTTRRSAKPLMAYLDQEKITAWCGKETERVEKQ